MMDAPLILERQVRVWTDRVVGTVAFPHARNELLPVLLHTRDQGATNAEQVAEHLLFSKEGRRRVAERLLRVAEVFGLVTQNRRSYTLTEDGERAVQEEQVFVPQEGAWTVWASEDPMLPSSILRIDPWHDPSAFDEVNGNRHKQPTRQFSPLPQYLCGSGVPQVACATGKPLRINKLEHRVEAVPPNDGDQLRLQWHVREGTLSLKGRLAKDPVAVELEVPSIDPDEVWRTLLEGENLWHRWDSDRSALRTAFVDTDEAERSSLVRQVRFRHPNLPDYGSFNPTTVDNVKLVAASADDAARWAAWRLAASVDRYATARRFEEWRTKAAAPFSEFPVPLPTRAALCDRLADADMPHEINRWHLIAAEDWSL